MEVIFGILEDQKLFIGMKYLFFRRNMTAAYKKMFGEE
jgi:hypothetical protein